MAEQKMKQEIYRDFFVFGGIWQGRTQEFYVHKETIMRRSVSLAKG